MPPPRLATLCLLDLEYLSASFPHFLDRVIEDAPPENVELRLCFQGADDDFHYAMGRLCSSKFKTRHSKLPGGVERIEWTGEWGCVIRVWNSSGRLPHDRLLRLLFHDVPLATEYAVCLDAQADAVPGWWEALTPLMEQRIDLIGRPEWHEYTSRELEMLVQYPWYAGVPFERRDGKPGVTFRTGEVLAVRSERLREADYPRRGSEGEIRLGEIARQMGWSTASLVAEKVGAAK